tara:strand:+ start:2456 stop:5092 length:2637 start_codon:yes stop_codon:yes gene_type:complete
MADNKLRFFLTGDSKQFQQSLTQAENKLKAFGSKLSSVGRSMTMFAAPVVAAGVSSIKMAASFDKSMTKIKTLVGEASDKVDDMRAGVIQMAKDTGSSADEAAEALFFITSAGIKGKEAMKVLNASLKASAIGLGDVATVADSATSAMNAYGKENLSATMATDVLTNSVRLGKLSSEELAGSIGQVIPIASNLGVEFHEVGATLAAMSRTGTNAATASMQLKNILISILKPSKEGAETLEKMGLSSQKLRQQIKEKGLLNVLTTLKGRFEENEDAQAKVFGSSRALMGVMDLLGKGFKDTEKIFADMANSAGVTAEAYEELQNSAEFKLRKAMTEVKETFRETGATLMEALLPAIQMAAEFVKNLLERFNGLSTNTKKFFGILTMAASIIGPFLIVLGSVVSAIGTLIGGLKAARIAMIAFNTAVKANPYIAAASAIMAIASAIFMVGNARKKARLEEFNAELGTMTLEEAEKATIDLSKQIDEQNAKIKHLTENRSRNRRGAANGIRQAREEIEVLKEQKNSVDKLIKSKQEMIEMMKVDPLDVPQIDLGTGDNDTGPSASEIASMTAKAILTTKEKQFAAEIAATKAHYDNLKKLNEGNAEVQQQLEISKGEKLKEISDGYYAGLITNLQSFFDKRDSLQKQVEDAAAVTDEQRKALEIQRTREFYTNLIEQAKQFNLDYSMLNEAMLLKIKEITDSMTEQTTTFASAQENINEVLKGSFSSLGNQLANTFGNSGTIFGAFLSNFLQTATSIMAANLATSQADATKGATQTALSFGPAASFVLPALVAGAIGVVTKAFSGIKKFASGGIVSTPTMGLMGEYPGARSNPEVIAPLDKLTGMIGGTQSNVQVGGEFTLRGQDLVVALQRADRNRERIK